MKQLLQIDLIGTEFIDQNKYKSSWCFMCEIAMDLSSELHVVTGYHCHCPMLFESACMHSCQIP